MNYTSRPMNPDRQRGGGVGRALAWRIVVVDDEVLPAELLKRMLTRLGHVVVGGAQNGMEALTVVRELRPDLVLMDLRMPVMDGWTATAELAREMIAPIVIVSALDDRESLDLAVAAGASSFLTKPVREDDLERALELAAARFADMQEIRKWRADAEQRAREQKAQAEELARVVRELREAQLHLLLAARRAAVASLARSLTHEINNALTPIIGYAQMIRMSHPSDMETAERTAQVIEHAQRIAGWTAAFRQVAGDMRRERVGFSLNGLIQDVLNLYTERFARSSIHAVMNLDERVPVMMGYPDQWQEVLMNLIQNAVEAMRAGGTLDVRTEYVAGDVVIRLSDSGAGIAPTDLLHVTEPGFSMKKVLEADSSLGWGLYTANEIVKAHHGMLEITSPAENSTRGTTVRVQVPLAFEDGA